MVDYLIIGFEKSSAPIDDPDKLRLVLDSTKIAIATIGNMLELYTHSKNKIRERIHHCQRVFDHRLFRLEHGDNIWSTMKWWSLCMVDFAGVMRRKFCWD